MNRDQARAELHAVFGHFQNLNLLALLYDLREGRTARQEWRSAGSLLCPVAHGMPHGHQVQVLQAFGQTAELHVGCRYAACQLNAEPDAVYSFVHGWDNGSFSEDLLIGLLEEMWEERLVDAVAVQELLEAAPGAPADANRRGSILQGQNCATG